MSDPPATPYRDPVVPPAPGPGESPVRDPQPPPFQDPPQRTWRACEAEPSRPRRQRRTSRSGLRGVSKRIDAPYRSGPCKTWLKS